MGCDHVLESGKRKDRCGICDGKGESCILEKSSYTREYWRYGKPIIMYQHGGLTLLRSGPRVSGYFLTRNSATFLLIRHPVNLAYESATFWKWIFWIRYESGIVKALNPDISYSVTKQDQAQFFTVNNLFKMATSTHALLPIFPEKSWVLEWIQIRVGYVWTGKFDSNADTCGRGNVWIQREKAVD